MTEHEDDEVTALGSNSTSAETPVVVPWSPIYVTLLISFAQGLLLFLFFLRARRSEAKSESYDIYERRVSTRSHRSPPPYSDGGGMMGWAKAAWNIQENDLLRCVGLDSYMYLRFLRLGFRCSLLGSLLGCIILIPVYSTGGAEGPETEQFNSITLANVQSGSARTWASVVCYVLFVGFTLRELWKEWEHYAERRSDFLAKGDADTDPEYRYAIMVENIPKEYQGDGRLKGYFERLFPGKVRQASVCLDTSKLDSMVAERQSLILQYEKADAFTHAKPDKPKPQIRVGGKAPCCGGEKVEALPHLAEKIDGLNREIDVERETLLRQAEAWSADPRIASAASSGGKGDKGSSYNKMDATDAGGASRQGSAVLVQDDEHGMEMSITMDASESDPEDVPPQSAPRDEEDVLGDEDTDGNNGAAASVAAMSSTGFVTFTSLRAKQCAVQCELSGKIDRMQPSPAPEPTGVLWSNVPVPVSRQRYIQMLVAIFWTAGVLFWAVPVTFVSGIANLNGILGALGLPLMNESSFLYGLIAGLLPVIFLQVLMIVLYLSIGMSASKIIRKKSGPEVDGYTFYWHQLYQFANLWLIVLSGSLFNQLGPLLKDPGSIANMLASALPGASTFFVNMISVASFGAFGMELSQVVPYVVRAIMNKFSPKEGRTQRTLDEGVKPQSIEWGKQLPPVIFIFLVGMIYMPIVPIVEPFAAVYFGGSYLVWTHQCLHVYAQEFEGGGKPVWENLSTFMFASLYMAQIIFIAYMGLKKAAAQAVVGWVCLSLTFLIHRRMRQNILQPLANLALEVAAHVDIDEGELNLSESNLGREALYEDAVELQLYSQPSLKKSQDERRPMPYRTDDNMAEEKVQQEFSFETE